MIGLNYCPICGHKFVREVEIHSHSVPGPIVVSNLTEDVRDSEGRLVFSYEGMMGQLRQMGYLVGSPTSNEPPGLDDLPGLRGGVRGDD